MAWEIQIANQGPGAHVDMSTLSSIEWTETTWNPVTGCTKISDGCKHCYAERMATRLQAMGVEKYRNGFDLTVHESVLEEPLRWKKPRLVFVNSMSDLFHEAVPAVFIESVFRVMNQASQHTFQVLTKRPARVMELDPWTDLDAEYMAGHEHRIQRVAQPIGEAERSQRPHKIPVSRTVTGAIARPRLGRSRLGDRRGRIRTRCPAHEGGLGAGDPRQLPTKRRPVFLQAVGRRVQETDRSRAR